MKRKRGAPPGNQNAFKHGFYSRAFTRRESLDLARPAKGQLQDEIILFKVIIDRIARQLKPAAQPDLSFNETVLALHVVTMAISRLNSFYRANQLLGSNDDSELSEFMRRMDFTEDQIHAEIHGADSGSAAAPGEGLQTPPEHGFYASSFRPDETRRLEHMDKGDLDDEIALLRILIKRTLASMPRTGHDSPAFIEALHAYRVIIYAASCLERLERTKSFVFHQGRSTHDILNEALTELWSDKEWWRRPGVNGQMPDDQPGG